MIDQNIASQRRITLHEERESNYPEIFDRAERTLAATFAQVGNLNYFTPS